MVYIKMSVMAKTFGQNYCHEPANAKKTGRQRVVRHKKTGRYQVVNRLNGKYLYTEYQIIRNFIKVYQKVIPLGEPF